MKQLLLLLTCSAATLTAQAPTPLEQHFQGRSAKVLIDMPGDDSGVDVYVKNAPPDAADHAADRLRKYGAALRRGQTASITLVKLKGDHIEFHLNGGGFTNRQLLTMPGIDSSRWGTSEEERRIRSRISGTIDKKRRKQLESDYDRVRLRRVRPLRDQYEREQRAQHGSRFNIRFASDRASAGVTVDELTALLRPYLELR